jgi:hypothetical protein
MFGQHFYHQRIRRNVATFGAMFNNLHIIRKNSNGNVISTERVPLSYAPKRKYLERIRENPDLDTDTKTAIKLPRMSFEITAFSYDSTRQVAKTNQLCTVNGVTKRVAYVGVPYIINFELNVYAKGHDDALQVVEQILPYFTPQYTLTIKPFDDYPSIKENVPITLNNSSFSDDYDGELAARRTIIYTLNFEMKTLFYGPLVNADNLIRTVITNYYLQGTDSDTPVSKLVVTPDPVDISPDSDYGFTTIKYDYIDSA